MKTRWMVGTWMCGAGLVLSQPGSAVASHCEYCNAGLPTEIGVSPSTLPPDGILMLTLIDDRSRQLSHDWWDAVTVEVRDAAGSEVAGTLETHEGLTPGVWRPDEPWSAGAFDITVSVDLGAECGVQEHMVEVTVASDAAVPEMPGFVIEESYAIDVSDTLGNLVCCDGAAPFEGYVSGISCPGYPTSELHHNGYCTHLRALGRKVVGVQLDQEEPTRFTIRERTKDLRPATGTSGLRTSVTSDTCLEFEAVDLVSGETATQQHCVEDSVDNPLGTYDRPEVMDELAASCDGPGYVCEDDGAWMLFENCWIWPDGAELDPGPGDASTDTDAPADSDEDATGCSVGERRADRLFLLFLLALGLRRRSRTS